VPAVDSSNSSYYTFQGVAGTTYGVSVFGYDDATGASSSPVSGSVTAADPPPPAAMITTKPAGATAMTVMWQQQFVGCCADDLAAVVVGWHEGDDTTAAPTNVVVVPTDQWGSVTPPGHVVRGLKPSTTYAFSVRYRDRAGQDGAWSSVRAQPRVPGIWLADRSRQGSIRTSLLPSATAGGVSAGAVSANGDVIAGFHYQTQAPHSSPTSMLRIVDRTSGRWHVRYTTKSDYATDPVVATAGDVSVAAWTINSDGASGHTDRLFYLTRSGRTWSAVHHLAIEGQVAAVTVDAAHRIHVALSGNNNGYVTIAGGHVTRSALPAGQNYRLATDAVTGRVVVAFQRLVRGSQRLLVGSSPGMSTRFGRFSTWVSSPLRRRNGSDWPIWQLHNLSAYGGRTFLALQRGIADYAAVPAATDGPYVLVGIGTVHHLVRVAAASNHDAELAVTAVGAKRALLTWSAPALEHPWPGSHVGIWQAAMSLVDGKWTFTGKRHWTVSPYDQPIGAFSGRNGHRYVLFLRQGEQL